MVMVLVPSPLSQEGNGVVVAAAVEETFQKQHYCCYNPRRTDLIGFGLIKLYCTLWYPRTTDTGILDNGIFSDNRSIRQPFISL